jgi:energy-coupling factor transport system substrate-specific component
MVTQKNLYCNGGDMMQNKKEKLNGKDFINIGIFTAIYMVIVIVIACTVGLIPIGFILLPIILPIIGGIPMMLYFTKVKRLVCF